MKNRTRTLVAVGGAVAALGIATVAYSASISDPFGRTTVRSGIPRNASTFHLASAALAGGTFPAADWWNSFGCTGGNQAPDLEWSGAPAGTKSYAITMFDKDASSGSGFWHMVDWDIPAGTTSFNGTLPAGAVEGINDDGDSGYMGPCPPVGDIPHHYQIRVLALDTPSLGLPPVPPALANYLISGHIIGVAELRATAQR